MATSKDDQEDRRRLGIFTAIFRGFGHRALDVVGSLILRQTFTMQAVAVLTTTVALVQAARGGPGSSSYFDTWRFLLVFLIGGVATVAGTLIWRDIALKMGGTCRCGCGGDEPGSQEDSVSSRPNPGPDTRVFYGLLSLEAASWVVSGIWLSRALFCEFASRPSAIAHSISLFCSTTKAYGHTLVLHKSAKN